MKNLSYLICVLFGLGITLSSCNNQSQKSNGALSSSAAEKVYVAPGDYHQALLKKCM
jgi:nitrous-oxide reductase